MVTTVARAIPVKAHQFFRFVKVEKPQLSGGQEQVIRVTIKNPIQEVVVVSALVTYPNGQRRNLASGTTSNRAELRWEIPEEVGVGSVQFSVSAGSGGCCGSDLRKRTFGTLAPFQGSFDLV